MHKSKIIKIWNTKLPDADIFNIVIYPYSTTYYHLIRIDLIFILAIYFHFFLCSI